MFARLLPIAALVTAVVSLHLPTRSTTIGSLTNAELLANGYAPAWPQALQHYSRSRGPSRLRRQGGPGPSATPTCQPPQAQPTVVLSNPTPLYRGADGDFDDKFTAITLPFPIQMYDRTSTTIYVSTNGLLSFDFGSTTYTNTALPHGGDISDYTVFPFWDDTYISSGTNQGIYYQIFNGDTLSIEYFFSHWSDRARYYHYTVTTSASNPGVFIINYYEIAGDGDSATVGAQGGVQSVQYSFNQPKIHGGTAVIIDTLHNTAVLDGDC